MPKLITQGVIMEYLGMDQAVFPHDAIITPSARDWAKDHHLRIVCVGDAEDKACLNQDQATFLERKDLLKKIIETIVAELAKSNAVMEKEEIIKAVSICLARLGCRIQ